MFAKRCTHENPKINWVSLVRGGLRVGDTFVDADGSVWQIQVDLDCMKIFPAKIQDAPRTVRLYNNNRSKHNIGLKDMK